MFQLALDRLAPLFPPERLSIITRAEHVDLLRQQAPQLLEGCFIIEPEGRGTAPAIGLAAIHLSRKDPDAIMAVLTADHLIADAVGFRRVLIAAEHLALNGYLVTLGIKPTSPSIAYGYIQQGMSLGVVDSFPAFHVAAIEKPIPNSSCHAEVRRVFMEQRHVHLACGTHPGRIRAPNA
jgi:mannose-1-phosphate guanylyltransferase